MKRRLTPFTENYNLEAARTVRKAAKKIPLILVGGLRRLDAMETILESGDADAIALCRPLICQPDLPNLLKTGRASRSACVNCNLCAVMCDSTQPLQCYQKEFKR
jgi:2,4-dienoyl-CoA reductase-like NADH-dependent reductase (Old Yellow Enzyme family)